MDGINTILRIVTWVLIPVSALLLWSQLRDHELDSALRFTVAGVVAMVPEGLVLLTSIAFGVAALTLARRQVLVQELPAVEGLARVDVVCLDKTGTLTEGEIVFDEVEPVAGSDDAVAAAALGALADDENRNATAVALAARFASPKWTRTAAVPFSSARKWSAATLRRAGVVGDGRARDGVRRRGVAGAGAGRRAGRRRAPHAGAGAQRRRRWRASRSRPGSQPVALVMFAEKVRPDAAETLRLLPRAGRARCRVISGDNPRTVAAVAAARRAPGRRCRVRRPRAARGPGRAGRGARERTRCSAG